MYTKWIASRAKLNKSIFYFRLGVLTGDKKTVESQGFVKEGKSIVKEAVTNFIMPAFRVTGCL